MNIFPDDLLISIFSHFDLREKVKFESVSRKWRRILLDKCFRKLGTIHLNYLVGDNTMDHLRLPYAIHSLVVQKGRIIEGIVLEFDNTHAVISVMQTLTSIQAQHLKRLEITINILTETDVEAEHPYLNDVVELISLCVNLEVLHINPSGIVTPYHNYLMIMDLSQLLKLKVLKFNRVAFNNFQAPGLVELECQNIRLSDDHAFRQMIIAISSSIEVLHLVNVTLCNYWESDDDMEADIADDVGIKMPKLRQLTLRNSEIPGRVINLSESTFLSSIIMHDSFLDIINFDLSVHCLDRFDVSLTRYRQSVIVDQFITSAIDNAYHFCLLKELVVIVSDHPWLNDLFNNISPLINYSFKKFHLSNVNNIENLMTSNLLVLVDCSPDLERIVVPNFVLDRKCLIDIIISRMRIVDIDFYLEFDKIEGGNELNILSDVYDALNVSNVCTKERKCDIKVRIFEVAMDDNDKELICFVKKMADNFRVFFTFGYSGLLIS